MKKILIALVMLGISAAGLAWAAQQQLDGKDFVGQLGKAGRQRGDKDAFVFRDGQFRSKACDRYGFRPGGYSAISGDNGTVFRAETAGPKGQKIVWNGMVQGDKISGTALWDRNKGRPVQYWFKGELKE